MISGLSGPVGRLADRCEALAAIGIDKNADDQMSAMRRSGVRNRASLRRSRSRRFAMAGTFGFCTLTGGACLRFHAGARYTLPPERR